MKLLYKDIKKPVAILLNMHEDDERVIRYVNEACERIINLRDWANSEQIMSFVAFNGEITLPPMVICPLKVRINGMAGQPYGRHYQFLVNGPGMSEDWTFTGHNLIDIGEFPTTFDPDPDDPKELIIWSDRAEAAGFSIKIRGLDENGLEVRADDGTLGETISWSGIEEGNGIIDKATILKSTTNKFSKIIQIEKDQGKGYVTIVTKNTDGTLGNAITFLHPYETVPSYRRFKIFGESGADTNGWTQIEGLFRIGYAPVYVDDDPLPINAISPIKLMAKAIWHYEHDEIQKAATLEGIVERQMQGITKRYEVHDNTIDVEDGYGMNDIEGV